MIREDIISMAREAGFEELFKDNHDWVCFTEEIERFAALVAAAEREACAMRAWADVLAMTDAETADIVLQAIRARGQAAKTCPPCHGDCNQGRACPARGAHA